MTEAGVPANRWRTVKLALLMTAVLFACLAAAILVAYQVAFPALGIDPNEGFSLSKEPLKTGILVVSILLFVSVICYGSAILGAWIAKHAFPLNEIESEFLSLLWLPGTRTANTRLFRYLFSRRADV